MIHFEHHEIHEGNHYACQDYDGDVDTGAAKYWLVKTPNTTTRIHLIFKTILSKNGTVEFFENPTITDNGSALTACNNDRNSANTATLLCYYDPTVTDDGTRLNVNVMGTDGTGVAGSSGGNTQREDEFVLKQNEDYIIKVTVENNDTRASNCLKWYELS